ncbi:hypothetical protein Axy13_053 [Achromobacter phage vB_AxyP_19-32_Axy13]|uniref:Uncharacterized protein n=1 Tax=Achromobacter phage vB_AxyP_19-32_Axy13 TaxID=2591044 RepID=A0A514CUL4_9CAUD|nr:hypothetical protein Axy13_053 [Achromobacter phage vB_AxyP_19-32_Axy13]
MGLFSSKTKVYVASSVYNMAGDIKDRSNYLKTNVVGSVVSNTGFSMGETIPRAYLAGPGIRMRTFANWSRTNYEPYVGIAYGSLVTVGTLDNNLIGTQIPRDADEQVAVQSAEIGFGDFMYWAEQWVFDNRPNRQLGEFEADYVNGQIIITYTNDGTQDVFTPVDYNQGQLYLYVVYNRYKKDEVKPWKTGDTTVVNDASGFPSTLGWKEESRTSTPHVVVINQTVHQKITWSDGRPPYEGDYGGSYNETYYETHGVWSKETYLGILPGESKITKRKQMMYQDVVLGPKTSTSWSDTIVEDDGGVTKTIVNTTTQDVQTLIYSYRIDEQDTLVSPTGPLKVMIYKQNSGNPVLDPMFQSQQSGQRFYPFIPIKINNNWVGGDLYKKTEKALKKATGGKMSKITKELKKNGDIGKIQYIYAVFGCSLNSPEDTAKEYIYRFFQMMLEATPPNPDYPTVAAWKAGYQKEYQKDLAWTAWYEQQQNNGGGWGGQWGRPEPPKPSYPVMPSRSFRIVSSTGMNYDMTIGWNMIEQTQGSGQLWAGAKVGQLRILDGGHESYPIVYTYTNGGDSGDGRIQKILGNRTMEKIIIQWQSSKNQWKQIAVYGAYHNNRVYDGKSVGISSREALGDAEESGFIIPLHEDIYRSMSLVRSTQMATACNYLVLNSYKKVKKKWYQSGIFMIVVIVVVIVITVYTGGAGGASAGLLGTNAAVGAALGFAGMAAIIVGAIANAVAAMILVNIITKASTMIFGEKLGLIIGTIASLIALQVGTAMANGQSMSTMMGTMMRADNLLKLTTAMGNGVAQYINAGNQDLIRKTEDMMQSYNKEMLGLQQKYQDDFGYGSGMLDPRNLTDINTDITETRDSFLARTLMTGSDIADMSLGMITNFADMNLQLENT